MKCQFVSRKKVKSKDGTKTYYFADFTTGLETFTLFISEEINEQILEGGLSCGDYVQLDFNPNVYNGKLNWNLETLTIL